MKRWCAESGTDTLYIDPGAPWQNGIVESFNGRLRDELLSSELLEALAGTQYVEDRWRLHYNHRRPQQALGKLTPAAYAAACPARSARLRFGIAGHAGGRYHAHTLKRGGPMRATPSPRPALPVPVSSSLARGPRGGPRGAYAAELSVRPQKAR